MSVFAAFKKKEHFNVPNSQNIKTENEPSKEDTKPSEVPVDSPQPEAQ